MNRESILSLSQQLISIRSDPDRDLELKKALDLCLSHLEGFSIELFEKDGVKSALIYNTPTRPAWFKLILNGHLDVIPGKDDQYNPVIKDGKLYGVGSMDMKSNVSVLIHSFKASAQKISYPLALQLVTDEEIGGFKGTKYQIDQGVRAEFVIAAETTNFDIVNEAKGVYWIKITSPGETAHGAYPWKGTNAIWRMHQFLNKLQSAYPVPSAQIWGTTINLAKIETRNASFNKIPDDCTVWLDIRDIPANRKKTLAAIKQLVPIDFTFEILADEPALEVAHTNHYLQKLQKVTTGNLGKQSKFYGAQGSSDARHYARVGIAGVEFGPIGGGIGTDNEWVDIQSLVDYYAIVNKFIETI